jgi:tRNA threonylcarbamoyladenosine biosynthesis protein TsaB
MNILAVDSSGNVCSAAVLRDERILAETYVDNQKTHSETLGPMADACLISAGLSVRDIDLFACAIGPGSFTGLRIGAGLVKAFAHASGKTALGVNTLDALAWNLSGTDEAVCPVIDARRAEVYTATYCQGMRTTDYRAMLLAELLQELQGQKAVFIGDAALNYATEIRAASDSFRIAHPGIALQRAGSVGLVAYQQFQQGAHGDAYTLEPFYLRESQAERLYGVPEKHSFSGYKKD